MFREVERFGQSLPDGSYSRRNRQAIATRETRVAARLRAVEQAYRKQQFVNKFRASPACTPEYGGRTGGVGTPRQK